MQWQYGAEHADKGNEIGKVKLRSHISRAYKKKLPISNLSRTGRRKVPPQLSFTKGDVTKLGKGHFAMNKGFAGMLIVLAAMGGQVLTAGATQLIPTAGFRELLKSAEAVAVVEILRVDNSATAADGPLILEVKVLAAPKGRVTVGQTLRTWESAWVAGTYRTGQQRLLLLKRQHVVEPYHRKAAWWNMPIGLEVFIEAAWLDQLTLEALQKWLDELISPEPAMPRVEIHRRGDRVDVLELEVALLNPTGQAIRLNPSCVTATFDAAQRHFIPPIVWDGPGTGDWVALEPKGQLSGTISVRVVLPEDVTTLPILIGHLCLAFPLSRLWVGYLTTEVPLD